MTGHEPICDCATEYGDKCMARMAAIAIETEGGDAKLGSVACDESAAIAQKGAA